MKQATILAILAAAVTAAAVSVGCNEDKVKQAAGYVAAGVQAYCATPEYGRLALRQAVADLIKPNAIKIECALDQMAVPAVPATGGAGQ